MRGAARTEARRTTIVPEVRCAHEASRRRSRAGLAVALAGGLAWSVAGAALAQDDRPGASDTLRLRVLDWDAVTGEVRDWPDVSGSYVVGSDGSIMVPFAGRIQSEGRRPDEIAADVVSGLRDRLALTVPPEATVEVEARRPVIVSGDVRNPGPVEFTPGLLAIQAVGLAGGAGPAGTSDDAALRRETASAQTALTVMRAEERRLLVRQARLATELAGGEAIDVPPRLGPEWTPVVALERQILDIRRTRLAREVGAIDGAIGLSEAEIAALGQKVDALTRQRDLADQATLDAQALAERGLVANQRLFETERTLAAIESQLLDVSTATLAARQDIAAAERERIGLQDGRIAEVLEERQEVDGQLDDVRARIAGQIAILDTLAASPALGAPEPEVVVLRPHDGGLLVIEDARLEPLRPGDMIEVERSVAATAQALSALAGTDPLDWAEPVGSVGTAPPAAPASDGAGMSASTSPAASVTVLPPQPDADVDLSDATRPGFVQTGPSLSETPTADPAGVEPVDLRAPVVMPMVEASFAAALVAGSLALHPREQPMTTLPAVMPPPRPERSD